MNKTCETVRKTGRCDLPADIAEYDAAAERLARICPAVDDLGKDSSVAAGDFFPPNIAEHNAAVERMIQMCVNQFWFYVKSFRA